MKTEKGWHFVGATLRDGTAIPPDGKWLKFDGPLVLCQSGLHWSRHPFDALRYAPGATLCRIEARGETLYLGDKAASRERRILCRMDATEMLRYFARMQALSVIHLYPNGTDDAVFDYLMTGDGAAAAAAESAARSAESAAWSAAESAARSAARSAAESAAAAAESAARSARSAAWSAAESAARSAESAAWSAAESAAESAQREHFEHLVNECFGL